MLRVTIDDTEMNGPIKGLSDSIEFNTQVGILEKESRMRAIFEELLTCWKDNIEGRSKFVQAYEEG